MKKGKLTLVISVINIVNIIPTNRDFLDINAHLGGKLRNLKFDVTKIDS